tara:strand:+ start:501 stop:875 length:375 start_codon:yes stop_codon:yes gene_type:complete
MANYLPSKAHQKSVVESLNADVSGDWTVSARLTIDSSSTPAHATKTLDASTNSILVYSDVDSYIRFDQSPDTSIVVNNDLIIPAQTLISIRVPNGLKASSTTAITVHFKAVTGSGTKYLRLVEV